MTTTERSLRIALLSYRGHPHSGGQGVYVRHLSKALTDLGHRVTVLAGQPYPDLQPGVAFEPVPSLDLYRADDPFRVPARSEFRDAIDLLEFATMCAAGFPEPLTFTLRAARLLKRRATGFDVVHDNQSLGYGLLQMQGAGLPVVATIHHPCSIDRDIELAHADGWKRKLSLRRWYAFTRMQGRVARRLPQLLTVSHAAKQDVRRAFGVDPEKIAVVHNGVDTARFSPAAARPRLPGRIVTTASADVPLKGLLVLVEALAKVRTEREAHLVVVGRMAQRGPIAAAIERFALEEHVTFESGISEDRLIELLREAQIAVVPSLYEGFSLPAIEAMACGTTVVASDAGALPEVVGAHGHTALVTPAGDAGALAHEIGRLLDDPPLRDRIGRAGRDRVLARFTWRAAAEATVVRYRATIEAC
jgi:glycosyltransferase involved in cell wall biosynthesis